MKKKLLKYLAEIEKAVGDSCEDALGQVRVVLEALEDKKSDKKNKDVDKSDFKIPSKYLGMENVYMVYSDGACRGNPGPGSYGVVVQDSKEDILFEHSEVFEETTNNRMEMLGVINGFQLLGKKLNEKGLSITQIHIVVITDSKYVIDGMTKWMDGWKAAGWKRSNKKPPENVDLWQKLDLYKDKIKTLDFEWVKGHAGHPQNEYCDLLANKALDNEGF